MNTTVIQLRAPKQRIGHWSDQRTHEDTRYEDPIALPLPRKERNRHLAFWLTVFAVYPLLVIAVVASVSYLIKH